MAIPIERLNAKLEGEFRFRGKRVSVPFALPGDQVQFTVERTGRRGGRVRPQFLERHGPVDAAIPLQEPFCDRFGLCGGCRGQHLEYDFQLALKSEPIVAAMQERFGTEVVVHPAPLQQGFRNRMDFVVEGTGLGLRPAGDFSAYVDLERCPIQSTQANQVLALVRAALAAFPEAGYIRGLGRATTSILVAQGSEVPAPGATDRSVQPEIIPAGPLKYATIRTGHNSGALVFTVAREHATAAGLAAYERLVKEVIPGLPDGWTCVECQIEYQSETSCVPGGKALHGSGSFTVALAGLEFSIPYDAFFQPSPAGFDCLLELVRGRLPFLTDQKDVRIVDLYCGVGTLGAVVAHWFRVASPDIRVALRGLEFTGSAVLAATPNLAQLTGNGSSEDRWLQAHFEECDLADPPADLFEQPIDLLIVDPPRSGISPKLRKQLMRQKPAERILYISCNPKSQLDDLAVLVASYSIEAAWIVDCFAHTGHLEQAVILRRRDD